MKQLYHFNYRYDPEDDYYTRGHSCGKYTIILPASELAKVPDGNDLVVNVRPKQTVEEVSAIIGHNRELSRILDKLSKVLAVPVPDLHDRVKEARAILNGAKSIMDSYPPHNKE